MPKYARLYRVHVDKAGYIRKPDPMSGAYRGVPDNLYRLDMPDDNHPLDMIGRWHEFRGPNRADVVIQARKWLSTYYPGLDVRS